jgi:hypothetical protein
MLGETADIRPFYLIINKKKKVSWTERKLKKRVWMVATR